MTCLAKVSDRDHKHCTSLIQNFDYDVVWTLKIDKERILISYLFYTNTFMKTFPTTCKSMHNVTQPTYIEIKESAVATKLQSEIQVNVQRQENKLTSLQKGSACTRFELSNQLLLIKFVCTHKSTLRSFCARE